jgi:prepilin-type N-terminal cleavage/methylation domain-containing protein
VRASVRRAGFTLIELLTALVIVGVLTSLAAPRFSAQLHRLRVRAALDELAAVIVRARGLAVRRGTRIVVRFRPSHGCARAYVIAEPASGEVLDSVVLPDPGRNVCVRSNNRRHLAINSRGVLIGSPRTIRARAGTQADSLTISIAGRVYRW